MSGIVRYAPEFAVLTLSAAVLDPMATMLLQ